MSYSKHLEFKTKLSGLLGLLLKEIRAPGSEKMGLLAPEQIIGVSRAPWTPLWDYDGKVGIRHFHVYFIAFSHVPLGSILTGFCLSTLFYK